MLQYNWLQKDLSKVFFHKSNVLKDLCNIFQEKHNNHYKKGFGFDYRLKKTVLPPKKQLKKCI